MKVNTLAVLFFDHFVNDFYSLFIPIFIPVLVAHLGINYFEASLLVATVTVIGALLQSPVGYWADLYRKRVSFIALGFLFYALGAIFLGLSTNFLLLFLSSIFIGFATTTYHPQGTTLITTEFTRKGHALGVHGVGGQLGRFFSPILIGFLVSRLEWRKSAMILSFPAIVAIFLSLCTLREPEKKGEKGIAEAISFPIFLLILILGIRGTVFQGIISFLPSFFITTGSSMNITGILTGIMLASGLLAQLLGGILGDKVSKGKIIFLSLLGLSILFFIFYLLMIQIAKGYTLGFGFLTFFLFTMGFCIFVTFPVGLALSAELSQGGKIGTSVGAVMGGGLVFPSVFLPVTGHLIDKFGFIQGFSLLLALSFVATLISLFYLKFDFSSC